MPDGTKPQELMNEWAPWVVDCVRLLDGDGTYQHWKYPGSYSEQPACDLEIYDIIRAKWNELKTQKMQDEFKSIKLPQMRRK